MKKHVSKRLQRKDVNESILRLIDYYYDVLIMLVSEKKLKRVLKKYHILYSTPNKTDKKMAKIQEKEDVDIITNIHSNKHRIIHILLENDVMNFDEFLIFVHELGHACCLDFTRNSIFNPTKNHYINTMMEEVYITRFQKQLIEKIGFKVDYSELLTSKLITCNNEKIKVFKDFYAYGHYQKILFLLEIILNEKRYLIDKLYNSNNPIEKIFLSKIIQSTIYTRLKNITMLEKFNNILLGFTCSFDITSTIDLKERKEKLKKSNYGYKDKLGNLKKFNNWIDTNPNTNIGDIMVEVAELIEYILLSRISNPKELCYVKDIIYYMNFEIYRKNSEISKLYSWFSYFSNHLIEKYNITCENATNYEIKGILFGILSTLKIEDLKDIIISKYDKYFEVKFNNDLYIIKLSNNKRIFGFKSIQQLLIY